MPHYKSNWTKHPVNWIVTVYRSIDGQKDYRDILVKACNAWDAETLANEALGEQSDLWFFKCARRY